MGKLTESIAVRYSTVRRTAGTVRLVDDETLCFVAGVENEAWKKEQVHDIVEHAEARLITSERAENVRRETTSL